MAYTGLRIHPAIGIARVGSSEEYYLGPESMAGMRQPGQDTTGGLPIRPGTERDTILSTELRDSRGRLKRQAARFRIYQYAFDSADGAETWPAGPASEVQPGSVVDGKVVADIIWTVHLANKKANSWQGGDGVQPFAGGKLPALRNPDFGALDNASRLSKLVIDAGPRALLGSAQHAIQFDAGTTPCYGDAASAAICAAPNYPVSFPLPGDATPPGSAGPGSVIRSLGALSTESTGRLVVLGGYGKACAFDALGKHVPGAALDGDVNNNNWFDDVSDGPVSAILLFADGSAREVEGGAWVIATDPAYAPQNPNVVTLWDELYCTWLEQLALRPAVYASQRYQSGYRTDFDAEVLPVLRAAALQKWTTFLPSRAIKGHDLFADMKADQRNGFKIMNFLRPPGQDHEPATAAPMMPLSLGDANKSLLSLTPAQYFFMGQWAHDLYANGSEPAPVLAAGEALDKTVLFNCLGGRFSPGIEMSFIVRDTNLYQRSWQRHDSGGPFRINRQRLNYRDAVAQQPLLGIGYTPLRDTPVQPGDLSKFMALPWHTDYNSCATHMPAPNPGGDLYDTEQAIAEATAVVTDPDTIRPNTLLYSSWPAQRPVAVYTYDDLVASGGQLPAPRFSVRGPGTRADVPRAPDPQNKIDRPALHVGRYQQRAQFLQDWDKIGVVLQITAISPPMANPPESRDLYLEVASLFTTDDSNLAESWRNTAIDAVYPPPGSPAKP
ncbi:LodA/GoxA family CTQ-dependent oxidase [Rugamonas sp. A1-17]|nr:LodA/GoxA family CTQ-dependent oxidase [Rugamonas sp. A1-17]